MVKRFWMMLMMSPMTLSLESGLSWNARALCSSLMIWDCSLSLFFGSEGTSWFSAITEEKSHFLTAVPSFCDIALKNERMLR